MPIEIHENDSLIVAVVVTNDDGSPRDLTGATLDATARPIGPGAAVDPAVSIVDAPEGRFGISFTAGTLGRGRYKLQARVTISLESQIVVSEDLTVLAAHL